MKKKIIVTVILGLMVVFLKPSENSFIKKSAEEILIKYVGDESKKQTAILLNDRLSNELVDSTVETNFLFFSLFEISNKDLIVQGFGFLGTIYLTRCELIFIDSDGDGISDDVDECPLSFGTGVSNGCPDSDGDGVIDKLDECPDEYGTNFNGCNWNYKHIKIEAEIDSIFDHMRFWYAIAYEYEGVFGSKGWYNLGLGETNSFTTTADEFYIYRYLKNMSGGWITEEWIGDYEFCVSDKAFHFDNPRAAECNEKARFRRYSISGDEYKLRFEQKKKSY